MYDAKICVIFLINLFLFLMFAVMVQMSTCKDDSSADCWEAGLPGEVLKGPRGSLFLLHWQQRKFCQNLLFINTSISIFFSVTDAFGCLSEDCLGDKGVSVSETNHIDNTVGNHPTAKARKDTGDASMFLQQELLNDQRIKKEVVKEWKQGLVTGISINVHHQ